ncbi:MAG: MMPL family transporter [Gammaproteobacteria bacterium]|nr:MMPL family transporter [Gammaproteobacteria bacterium]
MDLIRTSIARPTAVVAAVLMVIMFGLVALETIPIQLIPDVNRPVITIDTNWRSASPAEVEREIVNRQEEVLRGIEGLTEMVSKSSDGSGQITLEFAVGTNMDKALLLVSKRLDRVSGYPEEADEPTLKTAGSEDQAIAWIIAKYRPGSGGDKPDIHIHGEFAKDVVQDRLERVPGVGSVDVFGGADREIRVVIDPRALARFRLTVSDVVRAVRASNASITGGDITEGKRRYIVRTEGDLSTVAQIEAVVLRSQRDPATGRLARVTVGDVAQVGYAYQEPQARIRNMGDPSLAIRVTRETGANVIETMNSIRQTLEELSAGVVADAGLQLRQVYDETIYIDSAIDLVQQNIYVGGVLAALMLLLFLRSWRATLIIALAIPVSVIGSFVAMAALGRSLNVISLAGIAFAVGMVVDAAIVVLENIYRLKQRGMATQEAAYQGAKQVWSAVFVSALTTVMVFIPILILESEVGQLFRDIAVAISVAVLLSLLVAVTVIPALSQRLLGGDVGGRKPLALPGLDHFGRGFTTLATGFAHLTFKHKTLALAVALGVSAAAVGLTHSFLPKADYLPAGNRNLVFGMMLPPPGYNLTTTTGIAESLEATVRPLWVTGKKSTDKAQAAPSGGPPGITNFFFVAFRGLTFLGAVSADASRVAELIPVLRRPMFSEPGTFGFVSQRSIFGRSIGGGRRIDVDISGGNLEQVLGVALRAMGHIARVLPRQEGTQIRPNPGLELGAPEVRVLPDRVRLADAGVTVRELGLTVDTFNDGLRLAEITVDGERLDLMLAGPPVAAEQTQRIGALPVVTRDGLILPAESLAKIALTSGPTEIRHKERRRTVTIEVRPPEHLVLEAAMDKLNEGVVSALRQEGLPSGVRVALSGTADKLEQTREAMKWQLVMALIIVYLVMAVLFESFIYPAVIVLSVPLATAGGVGGLLLLNEYQLQPLDMLTMLGFVILIGIVVNNAILLVHQTLFHLRVEGMDAGAAIVEATRNRIRPIFMSTLTSVFGMVPLVVFPGAGSELYRGLGSVVVGGLALSALLTLIIVPPLLSLTVGLRTRKSTYIQPSPAEQPG